MATSSAFFTLSLKSNFHDYALIQGKANSILKPADATPKDQDYIRVTFRLLTATMANAHNWGATDFSDEDVLKESVELIIGKPAYLDHNMWSVTNNIGVIESAYWVEEAVDSMGNTIPAGIEGVFKVDAKKWPDIARDLQAEIPSIQSASVTVKFEYVPSHQFEYKSDFWWEIGEIQDDGRMCCRKATKILDYHEASLVSLGADPFAKIRVNGELFNIEHSAVWMNELVPTTSEISASKFSLNKAGQQKLAQIYLNNPELQKINNAYKNDQGEFLDVGQKQIYNENGEQKIRLSIVSAENVDAQKLEALQQLAGDFKERSESSILAQRQQEELHQQQISNLENQRNVLQAKVQDMESKVLAHQELDLGYKELQSSHTETQNILLKAQESLAKKEEESSERFNKIQEYHNKVSELMSLKVDLEQKASEWKAKYESAEKELEKEREAFKETSDFANSLLEQKQTEAIRLYKLGALAKEIPQDEQEEMEKHIGQMNWKTLKAYIGDKGGDFFEENEFCCPSCDAPIKSLKSSKTSPKEGEPENPPKGEGNETLMDIGASL